MSHDAQVAEILARLRGARVEPEEIRTLLDGLSHGERVEAVDGRWPGGELEAVTRVERV